MATKRAAKKRGRSTAGASAKRPTKKKAPSKKRRPAQKKAPSKKRRPSKKRAPGKPAKAPKKKAPRKRRKAKKASAAAKATAPKAPAKKRASSKENGQRKRATSKRRVLGKTPAVEPVASREASPPVSPEVERAVTEERSSTIPSVKETVDAYMAKLPQAHGAVASHLRKIVTNAAVGVDDAIKWAQEDLKDPNGFLHGATEKAASVRDLLKQAVGKRRSHSARRER